MIYFLKVLDYYSYNAFNNLCSYIKLQSYDSLKITFSELVKDNLMNIQEVCNDIGIDLIISFKNSLYISDHINNITEIEVFEESIYFKYKDKFDKIILNTTINNVSRGIIENLNKNEIILISDPNNISNYNILKTENVGIETENDNDIWLSMLNIKIFSFVYTQNVSNKEWSVVNKKNINHISEQCVKYISAYKKIIITGITGQDGSLLANYLLSLNKNFIIIGTIRSVSVLKHDNIKTLINNNHICPIILDLCDDYNTELLIKKITPDYFFNCAAQSVVYNINQVNIENTFMVNTIAPLRHLEYIRKYCSNCKYLSCGSCEEFGDIKYTPQDLNHPRDPENIYGITKNTLHSLIKFYRKTYNIYCCHLILYNHESIRRNECFVTKKLTREIAKIKIELDNNKIPKPLQIGNIFSKRDWSSSEDFVKAFWKVLNQELPDDYLLSSGKVHTIKELIDLGFDYINVSLKWDIRESAIDTKAYYGDILLLEVNPIYYRQNDENRFFQGNSDLCKEKLNWDNDISFKKLIEQMIDNDIRVLQN